MDPESVTCKPSMRSDETCLKGIVSSGKPSDPDTCEIEQCGLVPLCTCNILHLEASVLSPRNANDCYNS